MMSASEASTGVMSDLLDVGLLESHRIQRPRYQVLRGREPRQIDLLAGAFQDDGVVAVKVFAADDRRAVNAVCRRCQAPPWRRQER